MQDSTRSPASRTSQSSCKTLERQRRARIARNSLRVKQLCLVELTSCATRQLQHLTSPTATRKRCPKRKVLPAGGTRQSITAALLPKPVYCEYTFSEDEISGEDGTYSPCNHHWACVLFCGICTHVVNVMSCDVGLVYHCPILPCRLLPQLPYASASNIIKHVDSCFCAANELVDQGLAKKGGRLFETAASKALPLLA